MTDMNITYIYIALYVLVLGVITWYASRRQTAGEYLNSSKSLSAVDSAWTTFASLLTGYNLVLGVTFAFMYGFWYLFAFISAGAAFLVLYLFYKKRLLLLQSGYNLFSLGDYFGIEYGAFAKVFTNAIFSLALILFLTLQMYVNTALFSALLGMGKIWALLITVGVVCIYLWFGGFKASVKTDVFQGLLMLPIVLIIFSFPSHFAVEKISSAFDPSQIWFAIGLGVVQFLSLMAQPESFQRIFATKDTVSLKKGFITALSMLVLVAGSVAYLGINFKFSGIITDPSNLFTSGVLTALPQWLSSLLVVSLIAAFMGTIDSSAFALGILLTKSRSTANELSVKRSRLYTLVGIIISALASLYLFSFLSSVFALISIISVIGTALLLSFLFKLKPVEINVFLLGGTIAFVLGLAFKFVTDNPLTALIPSGVGLAAFLVFRVTMSFAGRSSQG